MQKLLYVLANKSIFLHKKTYGYIRVIDFNSKNFVDAKSQVDPRLSRLIDKFVFLRIKILCRIEIEDKKLEKPRWTRKVGKAGQCRGLLKSTYFKSHNIFITGEKKNIIDSSEFVGDSNTSLWKIREFVN